MGMGLAPGSGEAAGLAAVLAAVEAAADDGVVGVSTHLILVYRIVGFGF